MPLPTHHSDNKYDNAPENQTLDQLIEKAVAAAAKGENVEQILEEMLASLPAKAKDTVRKKFSAALAKRNLRQPAGEADIPSRTTLARIRAALNVTALQMAERIRNLVRSKPDVAAAIKQAGSVLVKNGVRDDKVALTDVDLGTMAPSVSTARGPRQGGRGA